MKKILFYVELYNKFGLGNLIRSLRLAQFFHQKTNYKLFLCIDNNIKKKLKINNKNAEIIILDKLNSINYDCVIYDSSKPKLSSIKRLKQCSNKIVGLDFFIYNQKMDVIINLHNHFLEKIEFKGKLFSGPKYAIICDKILNTNSICKTQRDFINVLITFGGEDPKNNTQKTLEYIKSLEIKNIKLNVIVGKNFKNKSKIFNYVNNNIEVLDFVSDIEKLYGISDLIICGGGTTLVETLFLGKPVIAIPQNKLENSFINSLKQKVYIYDLNQINQVINQFDNQDLIQKIKILNKNTVDGRGKERILNIVQKIISS